MADDLRREGTVSVDLNMPAGYWDTTGQPCRFPTMGLKGSGIYTEFELLGDHRLAVSIDGPLGRFWELHSRPITDRPSKVIVAVTWGGEEVKLYVNGDLHQTERPSPLA